MSNDSIKQTSQSLHVRPVRHGRRHAGRPDGDRDALPQEEGMDGQSELLRHLVATHPLRELDDRRAAASRAHAVPRDRPSFRRPRDGAGRHQAYTKDDVRYLVSEIEKLEPLPGSAGGAGKAPHPVQARRALERRPRHARDGKAIPQGPVRPGDLRRRSQFLQAARRDLHQGGRACAASSRTRSSSSPTMPSTASARNRPACARRSSIGGAARSARHRISRTFSSRR